MKKILPVSFLFALICMQADAQTPLAVDDFETTPSTPPFNFTFTGTSGAYITGSTGAGDRPASSPYFATGARAYQLTGIAVAAGTAVLTSPSINTLGNNFIALRFRLQAVSVGVTTNGLDVGDIVRVEISPNNGTTYFNTLEVTGFSNAWWSYAGGTGLAQTNYDANTTPVTFTPAAGGQRTSDGYSTVTVRNIPAVAQLRVRITMACDGLSERWVIDNAQLIGTAQGPLPVRLGDIKAYEKQQGIQIDWTAYSEQNLSRYEIERSADGITFSTIGDVTARNLSAETKYNWYDASPLQGTNFYRIKSVDADGQLTYSQIMKVNLDKSVKGFTVYPNPVTGGYLSVQSSDLSKGDYTIRIFNAGGQQVFTQRFNHSGGAINKTIQLPPGVKAGIHNLYVENEGARILSRSFMIQ